MKMPLLLIIGTVGLAASATSCLINPHPPTQQQTSTLACEPPASIPVIADSADKWLNRFNTDNPNGRNKFASTTFDERALKNLLGLPGVKGIKIYYAYDRKKPNSSSDGSSPRPFARLILMPVDGCGKDLVDLKSKKLLNPYYLLSSPMRCPDNCDQNQ
ncbi:hypothetical protein [Hymenobacter canadensis]|uniref:Uncharacterized protein n=1 Tax=Hymenobacter canadensis TaxID=2999067 RepID=A0ABY7LQF0_9BACT|nr:hypothetical protein [Hymenobacter canadensis]WBA41123.1 hypothetical protein O3303_15015 [Hymenobacter canadensis]